MSTLKRAFRTILAYSVMAGIFGLYLFNLGDRPSNPEEFAYELVIVAIAALVVGGITAAILPKR